MDQKPNKSGCLNIKMAEIGEKVTRVAPMISNLCSICSQLSIYTGLDEHLLQLLLKVFWLLLSQAK